MTLVAGAMLGPYEILSPLGAGGMGEVYRARDTRLKRDVAIKVLPQSVSADPERLSRFQREAELLAVLNHPNIAGVYGIEESGGTFAIVLELVEGETLADLIDGRASGSRLRALAQSRSHTAQDAPGPEAGSLKPTRGGLPLEEALPIARQIVEALEAAHDKGIIHRDLKPANIKITPDGKVKVLDFGLAKMLEPVAAPAALSMSPTLSVHATQAGVILGTAAYMSPEQARGKVVDRRTDIWSFGCVLFEMLAGRQTFDNGETVSDAVAAILKSEPDWSALPPETPQYLQRLLRRCLQKDPHKRLPHIGLVRIEIDEAPADAESPSTKTAGRRSASPILPWTVAAAAATAAGALLVLWAPWKTPPVPPDPIRLSADLGMDGSLAIDQGAAAVLSPDGRLLAFTAQKRRGGAVDVASDLRLYVRRLNDLQATPLAETDGARNPFFSPDGQWIAFFAGGKLKKISAAGGAAVTLCDAPNGRGGWWGDDGTIVFSPNNSVMVNLLRVSSDGGTPEAASTLGEGETSHRWPQVIAGGKSVLYSAARALNAWDTASLMVQPLPTGPAKLVQQGGYYGRYVPSGHVVYLHDGTLFAVPFDINRLEVVGAAVPVVENVAANPSVTGGAQFSVGPDGTLVYVTAPRMAEDAPIVWMDHEGKTTTLRSMPANWSNPYFSSDGRQLAMYINDDVQSDVWTYDLARETLSRLTFDSGNDVFPVWSPEDRRIVFASNRGDKTVLNLYSQSADGTGEIERLTESKNNQYPTSWHPSGKFLAFHAQSGIGRGYDLMILPLEDDGTGGSKPGKPTLFLGTPFNEQFPVFSPNGRWLAYTSNESGRNEIYVRPFPGPGGKWQISADGGGLARWSRARNELFYEGIDNRIMIASYTVVGDAFRTDKPRVWAPMPFLPRITGWDFDVHPDGARMALAPVPQTGQAGTTGNRMVFVLNFLDELRRIAPLKK